MKRIAISICCCLLLLAPAVARKTNATFPLAAKNWAFTPGKVTFAQERGEATMKISREAGKVVAKDLDFSSGTIAFDVKPNGAMTFYFRYRDAGENECFYLRMGRAGQPNAVEGVQYAPVVDGVLLWDLYPHFQSNATFARGEWNQLRFEIAGSQMRVYVNSADTPTLEVDHLEGNPGTGTIAFEGDMEVSRLVVTPASTESASAKVAMDPTAYDPGYIRSWAVSNPVPIPKNVDFSHDLLPTPHTQWQVLSAERRGLLNLTRAFGRNEARSITWLKLAIQSSEAQSKKMHFGFVDDVWVFLNGQMLYLDKNLQGRLMEKEPGGRCSVDNTSFNLPLKKGRNELLIGLGNDAFWGRGAIARLDDLAGVEIKPDPTFDARLVSLPEAVISQYTGEYALSLGTRVRVVVEGSFLRISGEGFISTALYPEADDKFFSRDFSIEIAFVKNDKGAVTGFVVLNEQGVQTIDASRVE